MLFKIIKLLHVMSHKYRCNQYYYSPDNPRFDAHNSENELLNLN